jgi:hypothetical protein
MLNRPLLGLRPVGLWWSDRDRFDERNFQRELRVRCMLDTEVDLSKPPSHRGQLREREHRRQLASPGVRVACASRSF